MSDLNELRAQLKKIGDSYARHRDAMNSDRDTMGPLIAQALEAGMSPGEVQQLTHLSAATIRTARAAAGLPPGSRWTN